MDCCQTKLVLYHILQALVVAHQTLLITELKKIFFVKINVHKTDQYKSLIKKIVHYNQHTREHTDQHIQEIHSCYIYRIAGKFVGLAVYNYYNRQIKIRQNFPLSYNIIRMAIPYQTAKFKSANILAIAILGPTAKFNYRQYFLLYSNYTYFVSEVEL